MIKAYIRINSLKDVQTLYVNARKCNYDLILQSGSTQLNPKSTMGIFSLGTKITASLIAKSDNKQDFIDKFGELFAE